MSHTPAEAAPRFGLIIVGDEILSGRRQDKHLVKVIELLGARGLQLAWAHYAGDDRAALVQLLERSFASGDVVFSCGGIGSTADDHTRQAAAAALGRALVLHPEAERLITERCQEMAREGRGDADMNSPENRQRLKMGEFPAGAEIIPNPFNRIPGFTIERHWFVPGFPVMAWPMIEWALDTHCSAWFQQGAWVEQSVIVFGAMEASLTPLMEQIERQHSGVKVFSLPSVDHPQFGRHIELGVKGAPSAVQPAYADLHAGLQDFGAKLGPELVR